MEKGRLNKFYVAERAAMPYNWFVCEMYVGLFQNTIKQKVSNLWDLRSWLWFIFLPLILLIIPLIAHIDRTSTRNRVLIAGDSFYSNFSYYYRRPNLFRNDENDLILNKELKDRLT